MKKSIKQYLKDDENFTYKILPLLLIKKIDYIKKVISPKEDPYKIMESLLNDRRQIHLLYCEIFEKPNHINAKKLFDLSISYTIKSLVYLKEQAFSDGIISSYFDFFRRREYKQILQALLEILLEKKVELFKDASLEEYYKSIKNWISQLAGEGREMVKELMEHLKDDATKIKYKGKEYPYVDSRIITPPKTRRIFKKANLKVKDEAILALALYNLPHTQIGNIFGITRQAVEKKLSRLWMNPTVSDEFKKKSQLYSNVEPKIDRGRRIPQRRPYWEEESESA